VDPTTEVFTVALAADRPGFASDHPVLGDGLRSAGVTAGPAPPADSSWPLQPSRTSWRRAFGLGTLAVLMVCTAWGRWGAVLLGVLMLGGCGSGGGPAGGEDGTTLGTSSVLGTWQISVPGLEAGSFELRVSALQPASEEGAWLGVGCMGRGQGGLMAPVGIRLSEQASGGVWRRGDGNVGDRSRHSGTLHCPALRSH